MPKRLICLLSLCFLVLVVSAPCFSCSVEDSLHACCEKSRGENLKNAGSPCCKESPASVAAVFFQNEVKSTVHFLAFLPAFGEGGIPAEKQFVFSRGPAPPFSVPLYLQTRKFLL